MKLRYVGGAGGERLVSYPLTWLEVCGQLHAPGRFTPGERNHCVGECMDHIADLDDMQKILDPTGTRTLTPRLSSP
jgi:hypothetical protein